MVLLLWTGNIFLPNWNKKYKDISCDPIIFNAKENNLSFFVCACVFLSSLDYFSTLFLFSTALFVCLFNFCDNTLKALKIHMFVITCLGQELSKGLFYDPGYFVKSTIRSFTKREGVWECFEGRVKRCKTHCRGHWSNPHTLFVDPLLCCSLQI